MDQVPGEKYSADDVAIKARPPNYCHYYPHDKANNRVNVEPPVFSFAKDHRAITEIFY